MHVGILKKVNLQLHQHQISPHLKINYSAQKLEGLTLYLLPLNTTWIYNSRITKFLVCILSIMSKTVLIKYTAKRILDRLGIQTSSLLVKTFF